MRHAWGGDAWVRRSLKENVCATCGAVRVTYQNERGFKTYYKLLDGKLSQRAPECGAVEEGDKEVSESLVALAAELNALTHLARSVLHSVVGDPAAARERYESALSTFLKTCAANGRLGDPEVLNAMPQEQRVKFLTASLGDGL